jgi:hypothetical protein
LLHSDTAAMLLDSPLFIGWRFSMGGMLTC